MYYPLEPPAHNVEIRLEAMEARGAAFDALLPTLPTAPDAPPPPVADSSLTGASAKFARADHTHKDTVQAKRLAVVGSGILTWTYDTPFDVSPIVTATVQAASGVSQPLVATLVGQPGLTSCQVRVWQAQATPLNVSIVTAGITVSAFANSANGIFVDLIARRPT